MIVSKLCRMMESNRTDLTGQVYNIGPDHNEMTKDLAYKVGHHCEVYPNLNIS